VAIHRIGAQLQREGAVIDEHVLERPGFVGREGWARGGNDSHDGQRRRRE